MARLFEADADLFVPGMADEVAADELPELGPLGIGGDRVVRGDDPAAVVDEVQQAAAQEGFHGVGIRPIRLEPFHVGRGGANPGAGAVVHDDRVKRLEVLGQKGPHVIAHDGPVGAGLRARVRKAHSPCGIV